MTRSVQGTLGLGGQTRVIPSVLERVFLGKPKVFHIYVSSPHGVFRIVGSSPSEGHGEIGVRDPKIIKPNWWDMLGARKSRMFYLTCPANEHRCGKSMNIREHPLIIIAVIPIKMTRKRGWILHPGKHPRESVTGPYWKSWNLKSRGRGSAFRCLWNYQPLIGHVQMSTIQCHSKETDVEDSFWKEQSAIVWTHRGRF